jgi:hypothetical protein
MPKGFHPRRQGDLGEASAIEWLTSVGAAVSFPLFHSPDYDLIADFGGRLCRTQVKTSTYAQEANGRFRARLATSGGNQSWTGVIKCFSSARCDFVFVLVGDGRRWFIPSNEIEGRHEVTLGGPKYSEFEVTPGLPLDLRQSVDFDRSKIGDSWGSADVGESGETVNLVPRAEWVRIPPPPCFSSVGDEGVTDRPAVGRTRISANHQLTIPVAPFEGAELEVGDLFRVEATGPGRLTLTRTREFSRDQRALFETNGRPG